MFTHRVPLIMSKYIYILYTTSKQYILFTINQFISNIAYIYIVSSYLLWFLFLASNISCYYHYIVTNKDILSLLLCWKLLFMIIRNNISWVLYKGFSFTLLLSMCNIITHSYKNKEHTCQTNHYYQW